MLGPPPFLEPFYWIIFTLGSVCVVFVFDWLTRNEEMVESQFLRHAVHIPFLLLITYISGIIFGFGLHYLLRQVWPIWSDFLAIWWVAAFALSHLCWVVLLTKREVK